MPSAQALLSSSTGSTFRADSRESRDATAITTTINFVTAAVTVNVSASAMLLAVSSHLPRRGRGPAADTVFTRDPRPTAKARENEAGRSRRSNQ